MELCAYVDAVNFYGLSVDNRDKCSTTLVSPKGPLEVLLFADVSPDWLACNLSKQRNFAPWSKNERYLVSGAWDGSECLCHI